MLTTQNFTHRKKYLAKLIINLKLLKTNKFREFLNNRLIVQDRNLELHERIKVTVFS